MINETIDMANASLHLLQSQNEKINALHNSLNTLNEHIEESQTLLDTMLSFTYRIYYKYIKNNNSYNSKNTLELTITNYNDYEDDNTINSIKHINKKINALLENQNKSLDKINNLSTHTNTNVIELTSTIKSI